MPTMMPGTPLLRKLLTGFSPDEESESSRAHRGIAMATARLERERTWDDSILMGLDMQVPGNGRAVGEETGRGKIKKGT